MTNTQQELNDLERFAVNLSCETLDMMKALIRNRINEDGLPESWYNEVCSQVIANIAYGAITANGKGEQTND